MSSHQHLIALSLVPLVGNKTAKQLISYCGGIEKVFETSAKDLAQIPGVGEKTANNIVNSESYLNAAEQHINYLIKHNISITNYLADDYPRRLRNYDDAPLLIYKKGKSNLDATRTVAIVGTRKPTTYGKQKTIELINDLRQYNVQIISGLAYGVDTAAHQECVAQGIDTVAVMGTGIDQVYPAVNRQLAEKITENGAVITEFNVGTKADRENFPLRNRIIAALADVTIVIQSAEKGGSLITAEYANAYHKDVFALPGRTTDSMSAGCNRLIKIHKAHLLESAEDIAYIMRWEKDSDHAGKQQILFTDLTDEESTIVNLMKEKEDVSIDWLHHQTKLPLSSLASLLLSLEFKSIIVSLPGKNYALIR